MCVCVCVCGPLWYTPYIIWYIIVPYVPYLTSLSYSLPVGYEIQNTTLVTYVSSQHSSVADPYHVDTDPDPGSEKIRYGSGSRPNFDTDPDPRKNDADPDPGFRTRKIWKIWLNTPISLVFVFILLTGTGNYHFSVNTGTVIILIRFNKINLFSVFNDFC